MLAVYVNSLTSFETEMPFEYYVMVRTGRRLAAGRRTRAPQQRQEPAANVHMGPSRPCMQPGMHAGSGMIARVRLEPSLRCRAAQAAQDGQLAAAASARDAVLQLLGLAALSPCVPSRS